MATPFVDESIVKPCDVLGGRYRVERVLGTGGMGIVVLARHIDLRTRFALKIMRPEAARDADSVERFLREARAAVQFKSEHCVQVLDVGKLESGSPFMVMEFLVGHDLAEVIRRDGSRKPEEAVDYILQACAGVAAAHARGIVHRDLKPHNLFVTKSADGKPLLKVLDFGLAKSLNTTSEARALTQTTTVIGSPVYMSPEQMRASREVDTRTDIWSLGVCLHELLTGKPPFDGATFPEICSMVLKEPPQPLPSDIPRGLVKVVARCLEKDPKRRFATIGDLADALEAFAAARGLAAKVRAALVAPREELESIRPPTMVDRDAETQSVASLDTAKRAPTRRRPQWPAAIVAGSVALSVLIVGSLAKSPERASAAAARPPRPLAAALAAPPVDRVPAPIEAYAPVVTTEEATPAAPAPASVPAVHPRHVPLPRRLPRPPSAAPSSVASPPLLKPKTTEF